MPRACMRECWPVLGRVYAIYLDGSGPAEVQLALTAGEYSGEWVDVESGKVARTERFRVAGNNKTLATPEFHDGIALRLRPIE